MLLIAPHGMRSAWRRGQVGGVPPAPCCGGSRTKRGAAGRLGSRRDSPGLTAARAARRTCAGAKANRAPGRGRGAGTPGLPHAPQRLCTAARAPGGRRVARRGVRTPGAAPAPHLGRDAPLTARSGTPPPRTQGTRPPRGEVRAQQVLWPVVRYGAAFKSDGPRVSPRLPGVSVCAPGAGHAPPRRAAPRVSPFGFRGWSQRLHRVRCPRDIGHRPDARGVA